MRLILQNPIATEERRCQCAGCKTEFMVTVMDVNFAVDKSHAWIKCPLCDMTDSRPTSDFPNEWCDLRVKARADTLQFRIARNPALADSCPPFAD